ncbi:hypothetical protein ACET3Z_006919 [Daucus carota]
MIGVLAVNLITMSFLLDEIKKSRPSFGVVQQDSSVYTIKASLESCIRLNTSFGLNAHWHLTSKTLEKIYVPEEQCLKNIDESPKSDQCAAIYQSFYIYEGRLNQL